MEQIALLDFGPDFFGLPIEDRIRQCRAFALEAKNEAALADREMRLEYIALAQHWSDLADELQRQA